MGGSDEVQEGPGRRERVGLDDEREDGQDEDSDSDKEQEDWANTRGGVVFFIENWQ